MPVRDSPLAARQLRCCQLPGTQAREHSLQQVRAQLPAVPSADPQRRHAVRHQVDVLRNALAGELEILD